MNIGNTLRNARERRGLSLTQLSSTTKIPLTHLEAMEANVFELVPPGIFVRGFLRAYAREVGLDPRATIDQFLAEHTDVLPVVETSIAAARDDDEDARAIDPDLTASSSAWSSIAVVAALVVAVAGIHHFTAPEPETTAATVQ